MSDAGLTAGDILMRRLRQHGVDYVFANGGTDFGPIIEALARAQAEGVDVPQGVVMPHETAAIGMAHGYYLKTGRPQAVMLHTNVGLANALMGAINAAAEQIPMFIASGRTPVTEMGHHGSRNAPIHWGQEMRDQAGMLREIVKWDFELRFPNQMEQLVDRAMSIAMSAPKGPVYMSLPREALASPYESQMGAPLPQPVRLAPHPESLARAAELLAHAKSPLILGSRSGHIPGAFHSLRAFAEDFAIPVGEFWASRPSLDTTSPMHAGFDPSTDLADADVVMVLDLLVPWVPVRQKLRPGVKIIQVGEDPLHARFPVRSFPADVTLAGDVQTVLAALGTVLSGQVNQQAIADRFDTLAARNAKRRAERIERAKAGGGTPMKPSYVGYCLNEALKGEGTIVTELGASPGEIDITRSGQFLNHPISGGLGWALPAALGAQLADRSQVTVATMGDGSYMFANPVACHQIAEALELPVLTIVFNNGIWNAVKRSTLDVFPDGYAAKANLMPITSLQPLPDFCKVAEASRGFAQRVENGSDLSKAMARAIDVIKRERRQALIEVIVSA
jgi:acetolactate synthase-1/2/3 large subunit